MKAYAKNQNSGGENKTLESFQDPGPSPLFLFMPKKIQIVKMLIKAAYNTDIDHNEEEE